LVEPEGNDMRLDQNIPFGHVPMHATSDTLAPLLDAYLARRAFAAVAHPQHRRVE
jgi:hypothetical protein